MYRNQSGYLVSLSPSRNKSEVNTDLLAFIPMGGGGEFSICNTNYVFPKEKFMCNLKYTFKNVLPVGILKNLNVNRF